MKYVFGFSQCLSEARECNNIVISAVTIRTTFEQLFNLTFSAVLPTISSLPSCQRTFVLQLKQKCQTEIVCNSIVKMLSMERIPDQTGYLVLTEDGAVLTSGGDLENDERVANIIVNLVTLTNRIDPKAFPTNEAFDKISITYHDHCYVVCLSNKKIHVVKKKLTAPATAMNEQSLIDV